MGGQAVGHIGKRVLLAGQRAELPLQGARLRGAGPEARAGRGHGRVAVLDVPCSGSRPRGRRAQSAAAGGLRRAGALGLYRGAGLYAGALPQRPGRTGALLHGAPHRHERYRRGERGVRRKRAAQVHVRAGYGGVFAAFAGARGRRRSRHPPRQFGRAGTRRAKRRDALAASRRRGGHGAALLCAVKRRVRHPCLKPRAHARPMRQHHDIRLRARPWRGGRDKHPAGRSRWRAAAASHGKRAFMGAGRGSLPHHGSGGRGGIRMHRVGGIRRLRRAAHGHTVRGAGHARAPFVVLQAAACAHR